MEMQKKTPLESVMQRINLLEHPAPGAFLILAGPCVVEGRDITLHIAETLQNICNSLDLPLVFKASYRKANRSRYDSFTGIGDQEALQILADVKSNLGLPIVTDVHLPDEIAMAAEVADILQIPAFLCRQTDLLLEAGKSQRVINIKKGQFLSPDAMRFAVEKVYSTGNHGVMLTERGTTFGYGDLVVDYRGIPIMQETGCPVILDVTHSLQQPNQSSGVTGGQPALIEHMARLAIAANADGIFFETHPEPEKALSDGKNMLPLARVRKMLSDLKAIRHCMLSLQ